MINMNTDYSLQSEERKSSVPLLWGGQQWPQHHRTPRSRVERDEVCWGRKKHTRANLTTQRHTILIQQNCKSKDLQFCTPWNDGIAIFRSITKNRSVNTFLWEDRVQKKKKTLPTCGCLWENGHPFWLLLLGLRLAGHRLSWLSHWHWEKTGQFVI